MDYKDKMRDLYHEAIFNSLEEKGDKNMENAKNKLMAALMDMHDSTDEAKKRGLTIEPLPECVPVMGYHAGTTTGRSLNIIAASTGTGKSQYKNIAPSDNSMYYDIETTIPELRSLAKGYDMKTNNKLAKRVVSEREQILAKNNVTTRSELISKYKAEGRRCMSCIHFQVLGNSNMGKCHQIRTHKSKDDVCIKHDQIAVKPSKIQISAGIDYGKFEELIKQPMYEPPRPAQYAQPVPMPEYVEYSQASQCVTCEHWEADDPDEDEEAYCSVQNDDMVYNHTCNHHSANAKPVPTQAPKKPAHWIMPGGRVPQGDEPVDWSEIEGIPCRPVPSAEQYKNPHKIIKKKPNWGEGQSIGEKIANGVKYAGKMKSMLETYSEGIEIVPISESPTELRAETWDGQHNGEPEPF